MNETSSILRPAVRTRASACPHDCPSTCALDVEILDARTIGRIRGAADNSYTAGAVHPDPRPKAAGRHLLGARNQA
jgi:hypothetical protein